MALDTGEAFGGLAPPPPTDGFAPAQFPAAPPDTVPLMEGGQPVWEEFEFTEEAEDDEPEAPPEPEHDFNEELREDFRTLTRLGRLVDPDYEWLGHRFQVRTLLSGELMHVSRLAKPWKGTDAEDFARMVATLAYAVDKVDGTPVVQPIRMDMDAEEEAEQRFLYIRATWYPVVIERLYTRYLELGFRVREVIDEMGKASG